MSVTRYERITSLLTARLGRQAGSFIAFLTWPFYRVLRFLKSTLDNVQLFYEARIAPLIALYCWWATWPIYKLLVGQKICFVANIGDVTGHIIFELDNYFRKLELGLADKNKRYVLLKKSSDISRGCMYVYKHKFWFAASNTFIYNLSLPIIMRYKDITLDCGLSKLKRQLPGGFKYHKTKYGQSYWYLYQTSKSDEYRQFSEYYRQRSKCKDYFPLLDSRRANADNELITFLNGDIQKIALIHIKTKKGNATIEPTDPRTYFKTLEYLSDLGYRLVFVGRERMPPEFLYYKVKNYANSKIATFKHDIQLFKLAEIVIMAGSGVSALADCFDKPYLFLNTWHLPMLTFSAKSIAVPALIEKSPGGFLKFSEQIDLYNSLPDPEINAYPEMHLKGRSATGEEILAAAQELMKLKDTFVGLSPLQERFRKLTVGTSSFWVLSRLSENFLQKHIGLLEDKELIKAGIG